MLFFFNRLNKESSETETFTEINFQALPLNLIFVYNTAYEEA